MMTHTSQASAPPNEFMNAFSTDIQLNRGCLESQLFTESHDPRNLCYTEVWDTEENLCSMLRSEHFTRLAALMETASEPPILNFRMITVIHGLEFAGQARLGQNDVGLDEVGTPSFPGKTK